MGSLNLLFLYLGLHHSRIYTQLAESKSFTGSQSQTTLSSNLPSSLNESKFTIWGWMMITSNKIGKYTILEVHTPPTQAQFWYNAASPNPMMPSQFSQSFQTQTTIQPQAQTSVYGGTQIHQQVQAPPQMQGTPQTPLPYAQNSQAQNGRCPYTPQQLAAHAQLRLIPEVANNPYCLQQRKLNLSTEAKSLVFTLNYEILSGSEYTVTYFFNNGVEANGADRMQGVTSGKLPLTQNAWMYFAASCDYKMGSCTAFYKLASTADHGFKQTVSVSNPSLVLSNKLKVNIGTINGYNYFGTNAAFSGQFALIELGFFYTSEPQTLWAGFSNAQAQSSSANSLHLYFDQHKQGSTITGYGNMGGQYRIVGPYQSLYNMDNNQMGVQFYSSSYMDLNSLSFKNESLLIKPMVFIFYLLYTEPLPNPVYILQKGTRGSNGYLAISLVYEQQGRMLRIEVQGAAETKSWTSTSFFKQNTRYQFSTGIIISPANELHVLYWDTAGSSQLYKLSNNFVFSMEGKFTLFGGNPAGANYAGYVNFYRFSAIDSAAGAAYKPSIVQDSRASQTSTCALPVSYYGSNPTCLVCLNSVLDLKLNQCVQYCPPGTKNGLNNICVPCLYTKDCAEFPSTQWIASKVQNNYYILKPTRPLAGNFDPQSYFQVSVPGMDPSKYSYKIEHVAPNSQDIAVKFTTPTVPIKQNVVINYIPPEGKPLVDKNHNIIYGESTKPREKEVITYECDERVYPKRPAIILAAMVLIMFFSLLLITLLFSVFTGGVIYDLSGIWKLLLHYWVRLQFVAMLWFLGLYLPCCIRPFLLTLYRVTFRWSTQSGRLVNLYFCYSERFTNMIITNPLKFPRDSIYPYLLHNIGFIFIFHIFVLWIYILFKFWDLCVKHSSPFIYKIFSFIEYTGLIISFAIMAVPTFVFIGFNLRYFSFKHPYMIFSTILSVFYLLIFSFFFLYACLRFFGPPEYFHDPLHYNKFYYFFAGYRNTTWSRSFDLWFWVSYFFIGISIGFLYNFHLFQASSILFFLVFKFIMMCLIRPFTSYLVWAVEIVVELLIVLAIFLLLLIGIYHHRGCILCAVFNIDGGYCWLILLVLFFALLLGLFGILLHLFLSSFFAEKYRMWGKTYRDIVQTNYITTSEDVNTQIVNEQYSNMNHTQYTAKNTNRNVKNMNIAQSSNAAQYSHDVNIATNAAQNNQSNYIAQSNSAAQQEASTRAAQNYHNSNAQANNYQPSNYQSSSAQGRGYSSTNVQASEAQTGNSASKSMKDFMSNIKSQTHQSGGAAQHNTERYHSSNREQKRADRLNEDQDDNHAYHQSSDYRTRTDMQEGSYEKRREETHGYQNTNRNAASADRNQTAYHQQYSAHRSVSPLNNTGTSKVRTEETYSNTRRYNETAAQKPPQNNFTSVASERSYKNSTSHQ